MACDNCHITKPIARCGQTTTVGTFAQAPATAVNVYVKKVSTKKTIRQATTIDANNNVAIDMTEPSAYFFGSNSDYLIWVTLNDGTEKGLNHRLNITMSGTAKDCVVMRTEPVYESGDLTGDNQELQLIG